MDLIPLTLCKQARARHDPEEVTQSYFVNRDLLDVVRAEAIVPLRCRPQVPARRGMTAGDQREY
jgi:hypothetical protein